MNPALASLLALVVAIVLSIATRVNVGLIAIAFAWLVGVYIADLTPDAVVRGFPSALFVTLTGVTLLFAAVEENGTLRQLAHRAARLARGDARLLPIVFFVLAGVISTVGPGAISSVALVAPLAMAIGDRARVPPFLTALMVANGANAGNLSPVSSVGVIANTTMASAGMPGHEGKVFLANFLAHTLVALAAYFLLGGIRLEGAAGGQAEEIEDRLEPHHRLSVFVVLAWIAGVVFLKLNVGLSAFAAVGILIALRTVEDGKAIRRMPWSVIVMVCGVTMLIAVLETTGGMDLFTAALARLATIGTVNGAIALVTGAISTYSSTSGVVLPAFLPTVPGLVEQLGGGDPLAIALSINVGSSLVDVSPLSTLGALCLAALPPGASAPTLFRQLLLWGIAMTLVGALLCQLFAGPFARV
jgi:Na+/H+ antiporter NhaD/arsenite permease-like protein